MSTVSSESPKVQYSVQREQSDGSLNRISVRVPYFSKDDIHVYVDDVEINSSATEQSTYTWRWDGDYIAITPNVASGSEVLVRRITPINEAIHIFDGRSEFDDQSMDENFQQLIYIAQEYSEGSGIKDVFSDINMHGYKITNVGWATDDDDIVTYGQYKVDAEGAKVARDEAKQHAQDALQYKQDTQGIATQAVADVATAKDNAITEVQASVAPEVERASNYATTAQTAANTAVSAKDRSELILTNVQTLEASASASASASAQSRDEAKAIKDELKNSLDTVQEVTEPIKIVVENIDHVVTTSTNINDVNIVGADLEGSSSSAAFQDYGDLDDPSGSSITITGGNIKTVADNITHVRVDSENIEAIKTVANNLDKVTDISKIVGDAVNTIKTQQNASVQAVITQQGSSITAVIAEGDKQVARITDAGTSSVEMVSDAETAAVQSVQTEGTKQVNLAKAQVTLATTEAQKASSSASSASASATEAKSYVDSMQASVDACSASETASRQYASQAGTHATNASSSASSSASSATASANSAKAAKTSEDNAASYKVASSNSAVNAKSSEIEAKRQADLAKGYANQASSGQVNADWNETVSTSKAFIKNKPTLGALAFKDSIAYSEITGTPPEQDLSGLATKNELQTGLADKANRSHTHTKSQITDFPAIPDVSTLIPKSGNRSTLAGYSTSANGTTVNATSGDSLYASANVTVANGATGQTWTKVVKMSAGTVTLGTNWSWVGGETPELKYPCLLVCHWNQDRGIAGIVAGV